MDGSGELSREARIEAAVAAWLAANASGSPLDRAEVVGRHPDLAPELERALAHPEAHPGAMRAAAAAPTAFVAAPTRPAHVHEARARPVARGGDSLARALGRGAALGLLSG